MINSEKIAEVIIGLLFFTSGIYQVVTKQYSDVLIVFLSVFSFGYWWIKKPELK